MALNKVVQINSTKIKVILYKGNKEDFKKKENTKNNLGSLNRKLKKLRKKIEDFQYQFVV